MSVRAEIMGYHSNTHMHTCTHARTHTHTHMHTRARTHTHMHMHTVHSFIKITKPT